MKYPLILIGLLASFIIVMGSCECKQTCPGFSSTNQSYISYDKNAQINFVNGNGTLISFQVTDKNIQGEHKIGSMSTMEGCKNVTCDAVSANFTTISSTSRGGTNKIYMNLVEGYSGNSSDLQVLDFSTKFSISPDLSSSTNDIQATNLQLGPHQYANALIMTADTVANPAQSIWQVYFSKNGGVLGFRDRQSHSLFYLQ